MAASVITDVIMVHAITATELAALVRAHDVDLIDVRNPDEWSTGHIPGARLVPLDVFRADPDAVLAHGRTLVFVCAKGVRSMQAAKLAERFGYVRIYNLEGGTKEWAREGRELVIESRAAA
jgi:adenylyltransferase/sulfurtransferase